MEAKNCIICWTETALKCISTPIFYFSSKTKLSPMDMMCLMTCSINHMGVDVAPQMPTLSWGVNQDGSISVSFSTK